jgi:antitoxin ParD1/3/4
MPTRNVNLTDELDHFVLQKVESGRYENASEVVRAALRTLEREEQRHEAKLAALRTAIDEGTPAALPSAMFLSVSVRSSTFPRRRVSPWPGSVFRIVPKPICSTSAFIPFAPGAKSRPTAISASLKIVASSLPIIPRSVASVMKFALGCGA